MAENKTQFSQALVTGASSGIGQSLCRLLAAKNIPLIITGRDQSRLQKISEELSLKVPVIAIVADLATDEGRRKIVDIIREQAPGLVVNNAGFGKYGEANQMPIEDQLGIIDVDVKAVLELTLEATRSLRASKKSGTILNVSSAAGFLVFPNFATYAAAKAFVTSFSESLDFELAPYNIRVLASCPGVVQTAFRNRAGGAHTVQESTMTASFAAEELWRQIEKGQRVRIFDWKTRLGVFLATKILPKTVVAKILSHSVNSIQKI